MDKLSIVKRAQQLMTSSNFWNKVDGKVNNISPKGIQKSTEAIVYANSPTDYNMDYNYSNLQPQYQQQNVEKNLDRLPEGLRESFRNQKPIEVNTPISILDTIPDSYLNGLNGTNIDGLPSQSQMQQMINEKKNQQQTHPQQQMNIGGQIDYNYIKFTVQEAIKEALENVESNTLKGIKLVNGGTFIFVDSKGNKYEAKLKKLNK